MLWGYTGGEIGLVLFIFALIWGALFVGGLGGWIGRRLSGGPKR